MQSTGNNPPDLKDAFYDVAALKAVINLPDQVETLLIKLPKEKIQESFQSLCIIGATGVGKSSTCNSIIGQTYFEASASLQSFTYQTNGILARWFGDEKEESIFLLDTPGLGDSEGRDTKHIAEMICALQTLEYVNAFVVCFNAGQCRMDENLKAMLKIFRQMFGEIFFNNVVYCLTNWGYDSSSIMSRRVNKDTKEIRIQGFQAMLSKDLGVHASKEQFIFVDNRCADPNFKSDPTFPLLFSPESLSELQNELAHLKNITKRFPRFYCQDLKAVMKENDALKVALDNQREQMKINIQKFEDDIRKKEIEFQMIRQGFEEELKEQQKRVQEQEQKFLAEQIKMQQNLENIKQENIKAQQESEKKIKEALEQSQQNLKEKKEFEEKLLQEQERQNKKEEELNSKLQELQKKRDEEQEKMLAEQQKIIENLKGLNEDQLKEKMQLLKEKYEQEKTILMEAHKKECQLLEKNHQELMKTKDNYLQEATKNYNQKSNEVNSLLETSRSQESKVNTLKKEISDLKRTCAFCGSIGPSGKCPLRKHVPKAYKWVQSTRNPSGWFIAYDHGETVSGGCCQNCYTWTQFRYFEDDRSFSVEDRENFFLELKTGNCDHLFL